MMKFFINKISFSFLVRGWVFVLLAQNAVAQAANDESAVLVEGAGITITAEDVLSEAQRMPAPSKTSFFGKPQNVAEIASNLYMRRVLATEAVREGLEKDPLVQAQLRIARDQVLSEARLAVIDKTHTLDEEAKTQFAKAAYQAERSRFMQPERVHVRHILVKGVDAEARAKADSLLAELKRGADFDALAKKSSDDTGSAAKGGDLGFFSRGRMAKPFEDAAFALDGPGALSPIVESPFGFHIIKMIDKRSAGPRPFSEVEAELKEEAVKQTIKNTRDAVVQRLNESLKFNRPAIEAFAADQNK